MKLMQCNECGDLHALSYDWQECECGKAGGMYRADGDTVLITESARLIGLCNHLRYPNHYDQMYPQHASRCANAWEYPENRKVTRLADTDARPTTYHRLSSDAVRMFVADLKQVLWASCVASELSKNDYATVVRLVRERLGEA